jgi:glycosyltransferase involved in cell wall biosynthesis
MVEAMAHGLPLLVADVESNVEIAGSSELAFPAHDGHALASLIQALVEDAAWHQACSKSSRERASFFTWQRSASASVDLMQSMLAPFTAPKAAAPAPTHLDTWTIEQTPKRR